MAAELNFLVSVPKADPFDAAPDIQPLVIFGDKRVLNTSGGVSQFFVN